MWSKMLSAGGRPANSLVTCNFSLLGQLTNAGSRAYCSAVFKKTEKNYPTKLALKSSGHVAVVEI